MPTLEDRVYTNERDIKAIYDRLGAVEDKSSGAWRTIAEQRDEMANVKADVRTLTDKVTGMEVDMKEQKISMKEQRRLLKVIVILLVVYGVISVGFFIYIWRHDADLAKSLLTFGTMVGGAIA